MGKFKIGDTVRCVVNGAAYKPKALGYKPDKEFVVDFIRKCSDGYVYFPKNEHGVHECDLMLVKTLPKSFACTNTNQKLWDKYIKWLDGGYDGDVNTYYGIHIDGFKTSGNIKRSYDTIIQLEEWDEIVNGNQIQTKEEVMKTIQITRTQLKEIWDVACHAWKGTLAEHAGKNPFSDMIKFTQKEVDAMFAASNNIQTPVLESIFGKQTKDINLSTWVGEGNVFINNSIRFNNALMCIRANGYYANKAFVLNSDYNWDLVKDSDGNQCLVPTRK